MEIIIRKAKKGDGKGWVKMWNEGIKRNFFIYNGTNRLRNKRDILKADKKYKRYSKNEITFVAIEKDSKKIVGFSNARGKDDGRTRHRLELGWALHPDYSRKGIATRLVNAIIEEARKRGIKRLEAEAAVENVASVKLAKKAGFKIEGRRKLGMIIDTGKYVDTYLFGMILK